MMANSPLDYLELKSPGEEIEQLRILSQEDRLPPVLLFHGRGSLHKSLLVARLCAFLICEAREACGHCSQCLAFKQNKHPSVLFLDNKERLISVEETQAIKKHLASASGRASDPRIVFIRDVERLSEQSTNKLLKTFEDMTPFSFVFMTTERRHALLETLLSRSVSYLLKNKTKEPLFSEKVEELSRSFEENLFASHYAEVYGLCEDLKKDQKLSLEEILEAQELALNKVYRKLSCEKKNTVKNKQLEKKKKHIALLRKTVLDKKIKLNKGLLLESLFLH